VVLREACRQMQHWHTHSPQFEGLTVSVNLSSKQFAQPGLDDQVAQILQETGPSTAHAEVGDNRERHHAKRGYGHRDAGQTASTQHTVVHGRFRHRLFELVLPAQLPDRCSKIDRSFINRIGPDGQNSEIVRTILGLRTTSI
jgi:EAL domain-containing protein (putative c-di-GMP-specific phosphodiesterase class I)